MRNAELYVYFSRVRSAAFVSALIVTGAVFMDVAVMTLLLFTGSMVIFFCGGFLIAGAVLTMVGLLNLVRRFTGSIRLDDGGPVKMSLWEIPHYEDD